MKKATIRLIFATFFLVTSGSTPIRADGGGPRPLCFPGEQCQ